MAKGPSPLLGYNTNVRHKGKLYHIQTEDSGVHHPHILTHLFADGGRVIASKKTDYREHLGVEGLQARVKKLMQAQHKAMFIALRDGVYDEEQPLPLSKEREDSTEQVQIPAAMDVETLERAATRLAEGQVARGAPKEGPPPVPAEARQGRYQDARPIDTGASASSANRATESIFGGDLLSEKSLDEVILSYLAEDMEEES